MFNHIALLGHRMLEEKEDEKLDKKIFITMCNLSFNTYYILSTLTKKAQNC